MPKVQALEVNQAPAKPAPHEVQRLREQLQPQLQKVNSRSTLDSLVTSLLHSSNGAWQWLGVTPAALTTPNKKQPSSNVSPTPLRLALAAGSSSARALPPEPGGSFRSSALARSSAVLLSTRDAILPRVRPVLAPVRRLSAQYT